MDVTERGKMVNDVKAEAQLCPMERSCRLIIIIMAVNKNELFFFVKIGSDLLDFCVSGVRCARITRFIDREYYLRFVSFLLGRPMCFPVGDSMNGPRADPPSLHLNQLAPSRAYSPRPPTVASQNGRFHLFGTRCPHSQHTHQI